MKNVIAGQLLDLLRCRVVRRGAGHLFAAYDTNSVGVGAQLFGRYVRIHDVEVTDCAARHDHVVKGFLERTQRQVHGPNSEQRERVDLNHQRHECEVENDTGEAEHQIAIEHKDALVLPGILVLQVNGMQKVLEERAEHVYQQDGVLEAEHELNRGAFGQCVVVGDVDEVQVEDQKQAYKTFWREIILNFKSFDL